MIGNSVERTISSDPTLLEFCMIGNQTNQTFLYRDQMTTCNEVTVDVVVTLALMTGIIMVRSCDDEIM